MMTAYNVEGQAKDGEKVTNETLLTIVGSVINNSADWHGFRAVRHKKRTNSENNEDVEVQAKLQKLDSVNKDGQGLPIKTASTNDESISETPLQETNSDLTQEELHDIIN